MARQKPDYEYQPKFTITEYLSQYSTNRNLDNTFINWQRRKDASNPQKTISEWNNLMSVFLNEKC